MISTKPWKGVVIEEGLTDKGFLKLVNITKTQIEEFESTEGDFHFHYVTVDDTRINELCREAMRTIKPDYYMHFWKEDRMIVIFRWKRFDLRQEDQKSIDAARNYGKAIGIPEEEMEFEKLFVD